MKMQSKAILKSLPPLKRIMIIGNGGREDSLAWALSKSKVIENIYVAPGNGGTQDHERCKLVDIKAKNSEELLKKALSLSIDLVVIGPEAPLADGLADDLRASGLTVFGPGADGAKLEASKHWAKELMKEAGIPTANFWPATNKEEALSILNKINRPLVVKADGLAAGKGVFVPQNIEDTKKSIEHLFKGHFGQENIKIVLEELLTGPEVSVFALCDGEDMILLPTAQDHKRLKEGDRGPNTGGMGAYAPAQLISSKELQEIKEVILEPTLKALKKRCIDYRGVIYAGLMITPSGPKVIEFNCRFGDPECQTLMPLLGEELPYVLQACAIGQLKKAPELSIKSQCSACVVAAADGYPELPRKGDQITSEIQKENSVQLFHAGTTRNERGELITSGGRVLSIVAQGESFDEAFSLAYKNIYKISFRGMNFRKDIGHQVRSTINDSRGKT